MVRIKQKTLVLTDRQRVNCRNYYKKQHPEKKHVCKNCSKETPLDFRACNKDIKLAFKQKKERPNIYLTPLEQMVIYVCLEDYQHNFSLELRNYIDKKKIREGKKRRVKELIKGILIIHGINKKLEKDVLKEVTKDKKKKGKKNG